MFVEDELVVCVEDRLFFSLVVELSVLEDEEGRWTHIFGSDIVEDESLDDDIQGRNLNYFINFDEWAINEGDTFFISIDYFYSFIGHIWLIEFDGPRTDELVGIENRENEFTFLIVPFEYGVTVVTLLVWGDEIWVDFLLGLADLYPEGGDVLENAWFETDSIKLRLVHYYLLNSRGKFKTFLFKDSALSKKTLPWKLQESKPNDNNL